MKRLRIRRSGPLCGSVELPADHHIGQCALTLAALASSASFVRMAPRSTNHRALAHALRELGVGIAEVDAGFHVAGKGLHGLSAPRGALHAGGSESTLQIITSLLCAQNFGTRVMAEGRAAEASVHTWLTALKARGAQAAGQTQPDGDVTAPIAVAPLLAHERLRPAEIAIPQADPATKLALLLSGLYAPGVTAIEEGVLSRDHLERALVALGVDVQTMGSMTVLDASQGEPAFAGFDWRVPGDFSVAAYFMALGLSVPGSKLELLGVGTNRSRTAFFDALRYSGADIDVVPKGDTEGNEPFADIVVHASSLASLRVSSELAVRSIDDIIPLGLLVPCVRGRVSVRDVARLREQPGKPLAALTLLLRSFHVECTAFEDGFDAECLVPLQGAHVEASVAPELKLAACVLGAQAEGETVIDAPEQLDALYPGVVSALMSLGVQITQEDAP